MPLFRKKPVVIEAMAWDGSVQGATPIIDWVLDNGGTARYHEHFEPQSRVEAAHEEPTHLAIDTLEGTMRAKPGDFIIKGVQGEFYPCDSSIFDATYEPAEVSA